MPLGFGGKEEPNNMEAEAKQLIEAQNSKLSVTART